MIEDISDPFREDIEPGERIRFTVLGAEFDVRSSDSRLIDLASDAFGNLPTSQYSEVHSRIRAQLVLSGAKATWPLHGEPPQPQFSAGNGFLCATIDSGNFAVVDTEAARLLVVVSDDLLRHGYRARYDLIEFAFLTLASRTGALVPLHAACIGHNGFGILLIGGSGSGKSTLTLHALSRGMQIVSEDSAFVDAERMAVYGVPNFLHLRQDSVQALTQDDLRRAILASPVIRRRSGVLKHEVDLRKLELESTCGPLPLKLLVFLSRENSGQAPRARRLEPAELQSNLRLYQPYAAGLPTWREFDLKAPQIAAYELRRSGHPAITISELLTLHS